MSNIRKQAARKTTLSIPDACDALIRGRMAQMSEELGGHPVTWTLALASLVTQGAKAMRTEPAEHAAQEQAVS